MKFDTNTNEHLIYTLKLAYRYTFHDLDVGTDELQNHLTNALCNLIGDQEFSNFCDKVMDDYGDYYA